MEEKQEHEYLGVMMHKSMRWHQWQQERVQRGRMRSVKGAMW